MHGYLDKFGALGESLKWNWVVAELAVVLVHVVELARGAAGFVGAWEFGEALLLLLHLEFSSRFAELVRSSTRTCSDRTKYITVF